jgi:hypothetical protein
MLFNFYMTISLYSLTFGESFFLIIKLMQLICVAMFGRGSPRINMLLSKSATKKPSPKAGDPRKHGGSPKGMQVDKSREIKSLLEFCNWCFFLVLCREIKSRLELNSREDSCGPFA